MTDYYEMNNGIKIPKIGFGTWQAPEGIIAKNAVIEALKSGYRHIDTAAIYGNEESVGQVIKESSISREDLFVTTKLWNTEHTFNKTKEAIDNSLKKLSLDYIDLYLIHWPNPLAFRQDYRSANDESWRAMEEAVAEGKIKSIGVSNFHPHHLEELLKTAIVKPAVNQIYLNPSDMQLDIVSYCKENDILIEAYSPLGTGKIFAVKELKELAVKYQKTIAQIVLRWSIQHGFLPLPKSVTKERIYENITIFDFELSKEDMKKIDDLKGTAGEAKNPDETTF